MSTSANPLYSSLHGPSSAEDRRMVVMQAFDTDAPGYSDPPSSDFGASAWWHALRRRWLLSLVCGSILSALVAFGVWNLMAPKYTAVAFVRIAARESTLLGGPQRVNAADFDTYKRTQRQLLLGPYVMNAALRSSGIGELPTLKEEIDQVAWLQSNVRVAFPDDAEIMEVRLAGDHSQDLSKIVNAVVDAYMNDVVNAEKFNKSRRLGQLERVYAEKESELRGKRTELQTLSRAHGGGSAQMLTLAQQNSLQQYGALKGELIKIQMSIMKAEGEHRLAKAAAGRSVEKAATENQTAANAAASQTTNASPDAAASPIAAASATSEIQSNPAAELYEAANPEGDQPIAAETRAASSMGLTMSDLEAALQADPKTQELMAAIDFAQSSRATAAEVLRDGATKDRRIADYQRQINSLEKQLADRRNWVVEQLRKRKGWMLESKVEELASNIEILKQQEEQLSAELSRIGTEASDFGQSSIEVEMTRMDIAALETALASLNDEIQQMKIDMEADLRIIPLAEATTPTGRDRQGQIASTAALGIAAFVLPAMGLILVDVRKRRINAPADVSRQLRLNVIGSVPLVPAGAFRSAGPRSRRLRKWKSLLDESVASIIAMLLRHSDMDEKKVIMVSSAMPGEGKSTLAGQLATSLARAGRRTLLIDFDLRRPTLDIAFGLPLEPGATEVLSGVIDLSDAIHQLSFENNLSVLTAGDAHRNSLSQLTQENIAALFKTVRDEFEFVIVDASPILPVVDARLIGQFVDGVVLSVRRDVSEAPKVLAAREVLEAYNICILGAVVIGASPNEYYADYSARRDREIIAAP